MSNSETLFIETLKGMGHASSSQLVEKLGWDKVTFNEVKESLRAQGVITLVRGPAGGIFLSDGVTKTAEPKVPVDIPVATAADESAFLDTLASLGHGTSVQLMEALTWDKVRFDLVKESLRAKEQITIVKGKSGGIFPANYVSAKPEVSMSADDLAADEVVFIEVLTRLDHAFAAQLMEALTWDKVRFDQVKESLRTKNTITIVKGKAGGIFLTENLVKKSGEIDESAVEDDGKYSLRLNNDWRISCDSLQFMVQKRTTTGWVSKSYITTHKRVLDRVIRIDHEIVLTPDAEVEYAKVPDDLSAFLREVNGNRRAETIVEEVDAE